MSKLATQILNQLAAKGLIKKDKPEAQKKNFKKGKKKTKFGKPANAGGNNHSQKPLSQQKPAANNGGNANGSHGGKNKKKKHFHNKKHPSNQQPTGQNQQQPAQVQTKPVTVNGFIKEPVVTGKVARIVHVADGVVLINYTERPMRRKRICKAVHIEGTNELPEPRPFMHSIGQQVKQMFKANAENIDRETFSGRGGSEMEHMHYVYGGNPDFGKKFKPLVAEGELEEAA